MTRTIPPYDLTDALSGLTTTSSAIDTASVAKALRTITTTFRHTPAAVGATVRSVSRISTTIASRDNEIHSLLGASNNVSMILARRNAEITTLLDDGSNLFAVINARRQAVTSLLGAATRLAQQLKGLVADNRATLGPALTQLNQVVALLNRNKDNIETILDRAGPFAGSLGESVSSGPFFQSYVQNLTRPVDLTGLDLSPLQGLLGGGKMNARRALNWLFSLMILAGAVLFAVSYLTSGDDGTKLTAYFSRSTGLYSGDDVRVLGVKVGEVDSVSPGPDHVTVTMTVDPGVPIPAGAKAAIVAPNLVTSRFVQLAPAYTGGTALRSGSVIPQARTAVPIEWDDIKTQLTRLAGALGPHGADRTGALGHTVGTVDANLTGSANQLHTMLHTLSAASGTFARSRGDLFGTVRNLESFVHALVQSDASVRSFSAQLNGVSGLLNDNRNNLALALTELDSAIGKVTSFVRANRHEVEDEHVVIGEVQRDPQSQAVPDRGTAACVADRAEQLLQHHRRAVPRRHGHAHLRRTSTTSRSWSAGRWSRPAAPCAIASRYCSRW